MKTKGMPVDKFIEMLDEITPDTMKNYQVSAWFQKEMCKILDMHNDRGTDYEDLSIEYLLCRLENEMNELREELDKENSLDQIIHECCDTANFLMMIAYKANQSSNNPLKLNL